MAEIERISHRHDQIMNWLIANPEKPLSHCAAHFNVTAAWLSTIIHSDVFRDKFGERQEAVFGAVMMDIPAKLKGLADAVMDKLAEDIQTSTTEHKDFHLDAFDKIMHRAGYAPASARSPAPPSVHLTVNAAILAEARKAMTYATLPSEVTSPSSPSEPSEVPQLDVKDLDGQL
jgi:hypothetical protein